MLANSPVSKGCVHQLDAAAFHTWYFQACFLPSSVVSCWSQQCNCTSAKVSDKASAAGCRSRPRLPLKQNRSCTASKTAVLMASRSLSESISCRPDHHLLAPHGTSATDLDICSPAPMGLLLASSLHLLKHCPLGAYNHRQLHDASAALHTSQLIVYRIQCM